MECCRGSSRPNRSDMHLSAEEEAKMEAKTRQYFDGVAPKRHTKPQRSDYSSQYVDTLSSSTDDSIPEMLQFEHLENDPKSQKLVYNGNEVTEEFVETEYYTDLNSVDKQHHTTGTGFIKVEKSGKFFHIEPDNATGSHHSCKGNPATNDWVPAASTELICSPGTVIFLTTASVKFVHIDLGKEVTETGPSEVSGTGGSTISGALSPVRHYAGETIARLC